MLNKIIRYFLENKLVVALLVAALLTGGIATAPFGWDTGPLPSDPTPVDAIPDIGENQQIVFTPWTGRSPQDVEDQVSYPLTTYLLGIPGVKSIRSTSMFGLSSIYIIFSEDVEFYWSRARIVEKLSSISPDLLPENVRPSLGPDATALGQVFWYTLEGRDSLGRPTGGWDLHELRTIQDFYVKYALSAVEGVSEVASVGGFVQEYQVDVNPDALKAYKIPFHRVMMAVQRSNRDVGAKTIEINQAEYLVRGLGYIKTAGDIENAVVAVSQNVPIRVKDIGVVSLGPAARRGALDKGGAEAVGGVVTARYGGNPLQVIERVKHRIEEISKGLPQKTLADGSRSQVTIVPFYDRSQLIRETLHTLEEALSLEIIITILVVIVMTYNLRASLLISSLLPLAVLMVFIAMRYLRVEANIVALSGIAIAIGTMVDLGIVLSESVINHLEAAPPGRRILDVVYDGASEVSSAILTSVSTTIVSFMPVFAMQAAEGKLFGPLAMTKTFALTASLLIALLVLPTLACLFFGIRIKNKALIRYAPYALLFIGIGVAALSYMWAGVVLIGLGLASIVQQAIVKKPPAWLPTWACKALAHVDLVIIVAAMVWLLAKYWLPLGPGRSPFSNFIFVGLIVGVLLGGFALLEHYYRHILGWCLANKFKFLLIPLLLVFFGASIWLGFNSTMGFVAAGFDKVGLNIRTTLVWSAFSRALPGMGKEFMPSLNEGSFLLMPTSMPHSGMEYNKKVVGQLDMLLTQIPEIEMAVGKLGRVESALDPAPISMYENVINYKPEYMINAAGARQRYKVDREGRFITQRGDTLMHQEGLRRGLTASDLTPDDDGLYFRNWRDHILSPDDIWDEVVNATRIPGVTSAPRLQPIETRLVMLQTGMRAPMGVKVYGPDLESIETFSLQLEQLLKTVPSVKSEAVFADRLVGKPYLQFDIKRNEIARYGLAIEDVQQAIEGAIGGMKVTSTVEGRTRFPVRVRYPRELREDPDALGRILMDTPVGAQVPLSELVDIQYRRGPQMIKSEDVFLVGYVLLDKREGYAEVSVVNDAQRVIEAQIASGKLVVPHGVSYRFSGSYENQVRAEKRLGFVMPVVMLIIFLILYFQFRSVSTSLMVFSGIAMAFSGGFIMLWLYGRDWFIHFSLMGTSLRDLFQIHPVNLSVAVWVGFIALFGIATDDGVLIATYLDQSFAKNKPATLNEVRHAVTEACLRRIRPALMTVSTTLIALLPVLSSTGRGADIMAPMAIPSFGGMTFALISIFIVPVLYSLREERKLNQNR